MVDPSRVVVEKNKLNGLFAVESGGKTNGPGSFPSCLPDRLQEWWGYETRDRKTKKRRKRKKKINGKRSR